MIHIGMKRNLFGLIKKIDNRIGGLLRKRYQSFNVVRPYKINVGEKELLGKVAVVTGGSGTIGRACCFHLAAAGAKVYVCGSRPSSAKPVADEINNAGLKAVAVSLNVNDEKSIHAVFKMIAEDNNGHIDILINSAGGSARDKSKNIIDQDVSVIDDVLAVNLRGAMLCAKEAAKYMITNRRGRIVNITSVIGAQGKAGFSEYAAAKGGSIAFVKSLAQEIGKYGITVNGVAPGIVQRGEITEQMKEHLSKTNFMGTYGTPEDIASMVLFLCSNKASFITGQKIPVDGGRSLGLKEF